MATTNKQEHDAPRSEPGKWALRRIWRAVRPYAAISMAVFVLAAAGWTYGARLMQGPPVTVDIVRQADFVQTVVASGHVEAPHRVSIGTQISGVVKHIPVAEGQRVEPGQVLIALDDAEARATAAQAQAAVAAAEARLRQLREVQAPVAEQTLRQAQVSLENARSQLKRSTELFRQGFIGQAALDDLQKSVDMDEAQLQSARRQFESALPVGSDYAAAYSALAQAQAAAVAARLRWGYCTINAGVAGILISRDVEPGDMVQPGKALMVLSPSGETQLVVQIDEKNLGLIATGQSAQASADAYENRRFPAKLTYINPAVDVQRGAVEVKLSVPNPPDYLLQDMTVSVDIQVNARSNAILVASDAVHDGDGPRPWVLKVDGNHAIRQDLHLGLRSGGLNEVLDGLKAGDLVVPVSATAVSAGSRLRPVRPGVSP